MRNLLPAGLDQAFLLAASELGLCSAAWLFAREIAAEAGDEGVSELRDQLGREFPVLDAVCQAWSTGERAPRIDPTGALDALAGATRVLFVGHESRWLDALVAALPGSTLGLLTHSIFEPDWGRLLDNYQGRLEPVAMAQFQGWAGARSALVTFAYGQGHGTAFVLPSWVRVTGVDVKAQFRTLLGWSVLPEPPAVYPRWLVEAPSSLFSDIVGSSPAPGAPPRQAGVPR